MADISAIFHWPPSAFDGLSIEELMAWRHRAVERAKLLGLVKAD
jgi:hypothetical protein